MRLSAEHKQLASISSIFIVVALFALGTGLSPPVFEEGVTATLHNSRMSLSFMSLYWLAVWGFQERPLRQWLGVLGLAAIVAALAWPLAPDTWTDFSRPWLIGAIPLVALATVSLAWYIKDLLRDPAKRATGLDLLVFLAYLWVVYACARTVLGLTISLHPLTYDSIAYRIDAGFGFQPSVAVASWAETWPSLKELFDVVYLWLPIGFPIVYGVQLRATRRPPVDALVAWATVTIAAMGAYHLCPVAGPSYYFGSQFPLTLPALDQVLGVQSLTLPAYRNGFPSMHVGWALMLCLLAEMQRVTWLRLAAAAMLVLNILATLGKGEHYLIDLVVAVPFVVAIACACMRVRPEGQGQRRRAIYVGLGLWLLWVAAVRWGLVFFETIPGSVWLLSLATLAWSTVVYRRTAAHALWRERVAEQAATPVADMTTGLVGRRVVPLFFISGFTGLLYEVILAKELMLTLGGVAAATYTALAVYLGGMAIGAWIGGSLVRRSRTLLLLYVRCEFLIALYCLATPLLFTLTRDVYVALAAGMAPDSGTLLALRVGCSAAVLLLPTVLMGITLPVLVGELARRGEAVGGAVARLYAANTLGAAAGVLSSGYFILPVMGVWKTTALCAAASLLVALLALRLDKRAGPIAALPEASALPSAREGSGRRAGWGALAALFVVGGVTLVMEVEYTLLLAAVAGNSAYALSLMLFSLLLGFACGAQLARRLLKMAMAPGLLFAALSLALACTLLVGVYQWNDLPKVFAAYTAYPLPLSFGGRETIRAIVCWLMMFPPALCIGAAYPLAIEAVAAARPAAARSAAVAPAIALNSLGKLVGVLLGAFVLLPALGTLRAIQAGAGLAVAAALLLLTSGGRQRHAAWVWAGLLPVAALFAWQPAAFDFSALASGANVNFVHRQVGTVIDHAESLDGGLTTVSVTSAGTPLKTLLSNGEFQGNDALRGETQAQIGFALAPLLHASAKRRALIIGYGTGVGARVLKDAGYTEVDIVDRSVDMVALADRHFKELNAGASRRQGVAFFNSDDRNFLLVGDRRYDLIEMEATSIAWSGAAASYNRDFYRLAKQRLAPDGVLQQRLPLHHISTLDIASVLGSVRAEFPYVWLYVVGSQGIVIASQSPRRLTDDELLQSLGDRPELMDLLRQAALSPGNVAASLVLAPGSVDRLLASFGAAMDVLVSTDDNLYLEYSTPRGNALDGDGSYRNNLAFLEGFSPLGMKRQQTSVLKSALVRPDEGETASPTKVPD